jgi:BlaI family transcriptional regulator, penicillinase repressor
MEKSHKLGNLQLAIMRVLWEESEATAVDVHAALYAARRLAPTTIATMLRKMEEKGVVAHRTAGRRFIYRSTVTEEEVKRSMVSELMERLFEGDASELVSHLLAEGEIDRAELDRLRERISARERKAESSNGR